MKRLCDDINGDRQDIDSSPHETGINLFELPELANLIIRHAVTKGVFHTYAALLCVSRNLYRATSLVIRQHFTKNRLLKHPSLVWHYGGKRLNLFDCDNHFVTDSVCSHMTRVTHLNMDNYRALGPTAVINNFTRLTHLSLNYGSSLRMDDVIQLTSLKSLSLRYNQDIYGDRLTRLHSLTELSLADTIHLNGNSYLHALTQVTSLRLVGDVLNDNKRIAHMTWIRKLNIASKASDINGQTLLKLPLLESLDVTDNGRVDSNTLSKLTQLRKLRFNHRSRMNDQSLTNLTALESLSVRNCTQITDSSLSLLTNLTKLWLHEVPHVTNKSLRNLTRLRKLTLYANVADIVLWDLTHLQDLVLHYDESDFVMMGQIEEFVVSNQSLPKYRQVKWKQAPKHHLEWHLY